MKDERTDALKWIQVKCLLAQDLQLLVLGGAFPTPCVRPRSGKLQKPGPGPGLVGHRARIWNVGIHVSHALAVLPGALAHRRPPGVGMCRPVLDSFSSCPAKDLPLPLELFGKPFSLLTNLVALSKT